FVAVPERCQLVGTGCSGVDRSFVMAKMKRGSQFQTGPCSAGQNAVTHVHRVLQMRKNDSFLKNDAADVIGPNRKSVFEPKLAEKIGAGQIELAGAFFRA